MTVDAPSSAWPASRIEDVVRRAVRSYHRRQEEIVCADFAAIVAATLRAMHPPAGSGERADGVTAGLEIAARTILSLAGVPASPETEETTHA